MNFVFTLLMAFFIHKGHWTSVLIGVLSRISREKSHACFFPLDSRLQTGTLHAL